MFVVVQLADANDVALGALDLSMSVSAKIKYFKLTRLLAAALIKRLQSETLKMRRCYNFLIYNTSQYTEIWYCLYFLLFIHQIWKIYIFCPDYFKNKTQNCQNLTQVS